MAIIAPSLLSANFLQLEKDCEMLNQSVADWYHLDIMDGRFVPNISFGPMLVEFFRKATNKFLDVHLMIVEPEKYVDAFAKAGADLISFHPDASTHVHRSVQAIQGAGCQVGLVFNPAEPLDVLDWLIDDIDLILIMSVNPGFGGQTFRLGPGVVDHHRSCSCGRGAKLFGDATACAEERDVDIVE